jgi:hypothetical protein
MRGDVAVARPRLQRATAARAGDLRVEIQARASLALALALEWKAGAPTGEELARALHDIAPTFTRLPAVRSEVRGALSRALVKSGRYVEAEFLEPGAAARRPGKPAWTDTSFIQDMIAQTRRTQTAFERFVLEGSYDRSALEYELASRYLIEGNYAAAAQTFKTTPAASTALGTDPFVMHIVDCHDCDHARYANAPWTHGSLAARLAELERAAKGSGEPAAAAALALGSALYNMTYYGNARSVLSASHQDLRDPRPAERWFQRAYDLSSDRELKAKAAYFAAKAELGRLVTAAGSPREPLDKLPVPSAWFPVLKTMRDTKYYREVLRECGHFSSWLRRP